jgi:hypothetical protein
MEEKTNEQNSFNESDIITQVPTTRGLGFFRSTLDLVWDYEEENLYKDLLNKKFDPNNSSYPRKLNAAIEIFVTKKNNHRITETFALCCKEYPKQIKICDSQALMAHRFLVQENKNKQVALQKEIETKDKLFINQQNVFLSALQKSLSEQIKTINNLLDLHIKERDALVAEEGDEIRRLKKALVELHHLNKTFILPKETQDGYCSDTEKDPENVILSYNDKHLLKKINVDVSMNNTIGKTEQTLKKLHELNKAIQEIQPIRY